MKRLLIAYSALIVLVMNLITYWASQRLPDGDVPLHWGLDGTPDRFGTREEAEILLSIMPGAALVLALTYIVLPYIAPLRENLLRSKGAYMATWFGTLSILVLAHAGASWLMTGGQLGSDGDANQFVRVILAATGILLLVVGNFLPKTRQNWFIGIRTPWTLSSELAWEKTHRLGGRLMMITGAVILLSAFTLNPSWQIGLVVTLTLGSALICVIYSFLVWRTANDKRESPDYLV